MSKSTRPDILAARTRAIQALQLRMAGASLPQVAERLGYHSRQAVWKAITSLLQRRERVAADDWRGFHLARLERLLLAVCQPAIEGDIPASQQALKTLVEIGKTTGVYSPIRVQTSGHRGGPIEAMHVLTWMPDDEWMRKYAAAWEDVRATQAKPDGDA